jgi:O-antigen/teichoic acid export membrane protein
MSALIALPIFGGLALTSHDVVAVTLSADYAPTATMLVILCIVGLLSPLTYFRNAALVAVKRLNLLIAYSVLDLVIVIVAALALSRYSAEAVVGALVVMEAVRLVLTVPVLLKDMHTKALGLLLAVLPAYVACAVMAGAVLLVQTQTESLEPWVRLGIEIATGGIAYTGYLLAFHRDWSMTAIRMLRPSGRPVAAPEAAPAPA